MYCNRPPALERFRCSLLGELCRKLKPLRMLVFCQPDIIDSSCWLANWNSKLFWLIISLMLPDLSTVNWLYRTLAGETFESISLALTVTA